jgi:hypothetical protein
MARYGSLTARVQEESPAYADDVLVLQTVRAGGHALAVDDGGVGL